MACPPTPAAPPERCEDGRDDRDGRGQPQGIKRYDQERNSERGEHGSRIALLRCARVAPTR